MRCFYEIKWPIFAWVEACCLFAGWLAVCSGTHIPRIVFNHLTAVSGTFSVVPTAFGWIMFAAVMMGPFLAGIVGVDHLLRVPRGLAWISLAAVASWGAIGAILAHDMAAFLPLSLSSDDAPMPLRVSTGLGSASLALLIHARPLWSGLHDRRFAAPSAEARSDCAPVRAGAGRTGLELLVLCGVGSVALAMTTHLPDVSWPLPHAKGIRPAPPVGNARHQQPVVVTGIFDGPAISVRQEPTDLPKVIEPEPEATALRQGNGSFAVEALVNEHPLSMVFDTGASLVTLRAEDAERLGISRYELHYSLRAATANGMTAEAPIRLGTLTVGSITVHDIPAAVAQRGALHDNLLGQSFLERLAGYKVENNHLIMHGR
ncbi:MAG: hypothetical protein B7Z80_12660 [Rhodospirillales bacterium 20-64-7]|nr:MAG: hypothetical protein B7Z80_12660 [Rhodospirillales bacterium 20-64-7]HQT79391.1 TIGR02281 family clan AA aspartic protease [Rhodopila sp.]